MIKGFLSKFEGLRKPDPAIFLRALNRLGLEPAEAVFVGDHPLKAMEDFFYRFFVLDKKNTLQ